MPEAVAIGPLLLATDRLIALGSIALFLGIASLADKREGRRISRAATTAVLFGFLAARVAYVARHWAIYGDDPLSVLAIWQGGVNPLAGIVTASLVLVILLRTLRERVGAGAALCVSVGAWLLATALATTVSHGPFPRGITLWTTAGRPLKLDEYRGKPFVVNLWATWCGPCRRELPMLAKAAAANRDVPFLLVNEGESAATVDAYLKREGMTAGPVVLDPSRDAARALGAAGYPTTAFVSADGQIVRIQLGELSRASLEEGIDLMRKHR